MSYRRIGRSSFLGRKQHRSRSANYEHLSWHRIRLFVPISIDLRPAYSAFGTFVLLKKQPKSTAVQSVIPASRVLKMHDSNHEVLNPFLQPELAAGGGLKHLPENVGHLNAIGEMTLFGKDLSLWIGKQKFHFKMSTRSQFCIPPCQILFYFFQNWKENW